VTSLPGGVHQPALTPNGEFIAFDSSQSASSEVSAPTAGPSGS